MVLTTNLGIPKLIGFTDAARALFQAAGLGDKKDAGLVALAARGRIDAFVKAAKAHRVWAREPTVRTTP